MKAEIAVAAVVVLALSLASSSMVGDGATATGSVCGNDRAPSPLPSAPVGDADSRLEMFTLSFASVYLIFSFFNDFYIFWQSKMKTKDSHSQQFQ